VVLSEDGYVTSTYHCRECGEAIVRTYKSPTFSEISLIDWAAAGFNDTELGV